MPALVTGASGFLGGRLAQCLAFAGEPVTVLARATANLDHLAAASPRIVRGSLTDPISLAEAVAGATEIFHCAAASTDWASEQVYLESNVHGTEQLLAAALRSPTLRRFVHVSTTDIYGYPLVPGDEHQPARIIPGLPYNRTKCLAEAAVWRAAADHGLPITVVRPATIYGPRGFAFVTDIAAHLRARDMLLVNSGRERGGFLYVDDAVDAMLAAAHAPVALGQAYNLCDGGGGTWRAYVDGLADALSLPRPWLNLPFPVAMLAAHGMELPYRIVPRLSGRPLLTRHAVLLLGRDQEFPIHKAATDLGFRPRVDLADGIARSAAWLRTAQT